jgi:hypothetical protein
MDIRVREQLARDVARPRGEGLGLKLDRLEAIEAKGAGRGATEVPGQEIPGREGCVVFRPRTVRVRLVFRAL